MNLLLSVLNKLYEIGIELKFKIFPKNFVHIIWRLTRILERGPRFFANNRKVMLCFPTSLSPKP